MQGSSEKYSKLRPQRGLRLVFRPGPSSTATSCAAASSPIAWPICSPRAGSQLHATVAAVGKQVAGTLGFSPRWSAAPACLRTPLGPSDRVMDGILFFGSARVPKVVAPESSAHFCSSVKACSCFFCIRWFLFLKTALRPTAQPRKVGGDGPQGSCTAYKLHFTVPFSSCSF